MYYGDTQQHHRPHVHAVYQDEEAIVAIPSGEVIEGEIHRTALRRLRGWLALNEEAVRWAKAAADVHITRAD